MKIIAEISPPLSEITSLVSCNKEKLKRNLSILAVNMQFKQEKRKPILTNATGKLRGYFQLVNQN